MKLVTAVQFTRAKLYILGIVTLLLMGWLVTASIEMIPLGHVGVFAHETPETQPGCLSAGLHCCWPWRDVHEVDTRTRSIDLAERQRRTADGQTVLVSGYVTWHVPDSGAYRFVQAGETDVVLETLTQSIWNAIDVELAGNRLAELITAESDDVLEDGPLSQACLRILARCGTEAANRFGVELLDVRFNLTRPESLRSTAYRRMISQQHRRIDNTRTVAMIEAKRILSQTDVEIEKLISETDAYVANVNATTERQIADIYHAADLNPPFLGLVTTLDRYRRLMEENAALIVSDEQLFGSLNAVPPGTNPAPSTE